MWIGVLALYMLLWRWDHKCPIIGPTLVWSSGHGCISVNCNILAFLNAISARHMALRGAGVEFCVVSVDTIVLSPEHQWPTN